MIPDSSERKRSADANAVSDKTETTSGGLPALSGESVSPELSFSFTHPRPKALATAPAGAVFTAIRTSVPFVASGKVHRRKTDPSTASLRALPGLDAWSLNCRRKTLRGELRAWLLKSRNSVR
ncbi:MAG: hypothetical protein M3Y08_00970 [Fibrobacterota bacterium]|nr:hypothetical protein [Fibrobacterota bacterium]